MAAKAFDASSDGYQDATSMKDEASLLDGLVAAGINHLLVQVFSNTPSNVSQPPAHQRPIRNCTSSRQSSGASLARQVGKSCIAVRFVRGDFFEYQEPTIGAACARRALNFCFHHQK